MAGAKKAGRPGSFSDFREKENGDLRVNPPKQFSMSICYPVCVTDVEVHCIAYTQRKWGGERGGELQLLEAARDSKAELGSPLLNSSTSQVDASFTVLGEIPT